MALRGFLMAFWTLVTVAALAIYGSIHYGATACDWLQRMIENYPKTLDALNYFATGLLIWRCS